jgi:carbonic anhydrase
MPLLEAIIQTNERWVHGDKTAALPRTEYANALPVAALTCIDARLNSLLPRILGLAEEDFIWLRNPGNVITGPLSDTLRSLVLACALKDAKEIAIIGHTDCLVCKTTMLTLTDALRKMGVDRNRLPDNLTDYFGLFASERQNVIRAVDHIRHSPLIGPSIPVHGLLLDVRTGRLEWIVNGYQAFVASGPEIKLEARIGDRELLEAKLPLPGLQLGEMRFPDFKIGEVTVHAEIQTTPTPGPTPESPQPVQPTQESPDWQAELQRLLNNAAIKCRIIGSDLKQYGPITGTKLLTWLTEGRINAKTPVQIEGLSAWTPLSALAGLLRSGKLPLPPPLSTTKSKGPAKASTKQ